MQDNHNFLFTMQQPSEHNILGFSDQTHQSNLTNQIKSNIHQQIEPKIIRITQKQKVNQVDEEPDIIVFNYDEQGEQENQNMQIKNFKKQKKRAKNQFTKEISTQQQAISEKQDMNRDISQTQIQSPQKRPLKLHKSTILGEIQTNQFHQSIYQSDKNFIPICRPKQLILQIKSIFSIERILFFPRKFHMFVQEKHRLTARQKIFHSSSLYYFFSNPEQLSTKGHFYVGYMQANFKGTQYSIFNHEGINLAHVIYVPGILEEPIDIKIYLPKKLSSKKQDNKKNILQRFRQNDSQIVCFSNKKPTLNLNTKKYSLNLKGRAKLPSIKNCVFQIGGNSCLLFGKQKQKMYCLDYGKPFSDLVAFALCISNYEDKVLTKRQQ